MKMYTTKLLENRRLVELLVPIKAERKHNCKNVDKFLVNKDEVYIAPDYELFLKAVFMNLVMIYKDELSRRCHFVKHVGKTYDYYQDAHGWVRPLKEMRYSFEEVEATKIVFESIVDTILNNDQEKIRALTH